MMVHYKDRKDALLLKKELDVVVLDYLNHDKYAMSKFLSIISDKFAYPEIQINQRLLHSGVTIQESKQKYSLCAMTLL